MNKIFKAPSDPHRLQLLDDLKTTMAKLLRLGVMKHLNVLEKVGLIEASLLKLFIHDMGINIAPSHLMKAIWDCANDGKA